MDLVIEFRLNPAIGAVVAIEGLPGNLCDAHGKALAG
jgi:hypothetical protein